MTHKTPRSRVEGGRKCVRPGALHTILRLALIRIRISNSFLLMGSGEDIRFFQAKDFHLIPKSQRGSSPVVIRSGTI